MRTITRSILATTAVVGLLALPVAGAGAASTSTTVTLNSAGTLSISVPTADLSTPVNLGSTAISNGGTLATNGLGNVTISDQRTGLIRTVTVTTASGVATTAATVAFCQDANDNIGDGLVCSDEVGESIPLTGAVYNFNTLTTTGASTVVPTATPGVLGTATLALAATAGTFTTTWNPDFDITLLGTEIAGTFYGEVQHSAS